MIEIKVFLKSTGEALKRMPVTIYPDNGEPLTAITSRSGVVQFSLEQCGGRIEVDGRSCFQGILKDRIEIPLWSMIGADNSDTETGLGGSTAYASMQIRPVEVDGRMVRTDSEGYLVDPSDWSEAFVRAQASSEGLELNDRHWQVIRYLRQYYNEHRVQPQVRVIIRHFSTLWGREAASNRALHQLFPRGGPQKQGNRLAGLLRTKGEH